MERPAKKPPCLRLSKKGLEKRYYIKSRIIDLVTTMTTLSSVYGIVVVVRLCESASIDRAKPTGHSTQLARHRSAIKRVSRQRARRSLVAFILLLANFFRQKTFACLRRQKTKRTDCGRSNSLKRILFFLSFSPFFCAGQTRNYNWLVEKDPFVTHVANIQNHAKKLRYLPR